MLWNVFESGGENGRLGIGILMRRKGWVELRVIVSSNRGSDGRCRASSEGLEASLRSYVLLVELARK